MEHSGNNERKDEAKTEAKSDADTQVDAVQDGNAQDENNIDNLTEGTASGQDHETADVQFGESIGERGVAEEAVEQLDEPTDDQGDIESSIEHDEQNSEQDSEGAMSLPTEELAVHSEDHVDQLEPIDEIEDDWDGKPKRYKTVLAVFSTFLIMFCILIGIGIGVLAYGVKMLSPTEPADDPVRITIPAGSNSSKIAVILEENGLIRDQKLFGYYLRYKNEGRLFQAGTYDMHPGMEIDEIIDKLNRGDTVKIEMIRFTIQEGLTVTQIAEKLSEEGYIDSDSFLTLLHHPTSLNAASDYIKYIPDHPDLRIPMEGYLFPETYELKKGSSEQEIVQRLVQELDRKLATLPVGWEAQLDTLNITFHEMMTIASMIEREVVVDAERSIVSGVIQNRIASGMPLQIDATVQYALAEHREIVSIEDTKFESPYNTYYVQGLPPGPIAAPGISSIRAALYPEETEYLYYVTKKDGTHEHYFAKTFEQHQKNIQLSKNN